jgi:hypothetical protein
VSREDVGSLCLDDQVAVDNHVEPEMAEIEMLVAHRDSDFSADIMPALPELPLEGTDVVRLQESEAEVVVHPIEGPNRTDEQGSFGIVVHDPTLETDGEWQSRIHFRACPIISEHDESVRK